MMDWSHIFKISVITVPAVVVFIELFIKLPVLDIINDLKEDSFKAISIIKSKRISDRWKEKIIPVYSLKIFRASFSTVFYLIILLIVFIIIFCILGLFVFGSLDIVFQALMSLKTQIIIIIFGTIYVVVRKMSSSQETDSSNGIGSEYSLFSKLLHRVALNNLIIKEVAFDVDCIVAGPIKVNPKERYSPIFVSGLARAGTTILLEALYSTKAFSTLTYRNMPFVTAPYLWGKMSRKHRTYSELKERAHGDSLLVNYDSPEAFEEVFWKTFTKKKYVHESYLSVNETIDDELVVKFRQYVSNIVGHNSFHPTLRYLSKNNNNLLRLGAIKSAFPDSIIVVPFRNPYDHARSLLNQHERFLKTHKEDPFSLEYMNWLGHFEFGLNHKPFRMLEESSPNSPDNSLTIDYWLTYWKHVYEYVLKKHPNDVVFFDYNRFCEEPLDCIEVLCKRFNLDHDTMVLFEKNIKKARNYDFNDSEDKTPHDVHILHSKLKDMSII